MQTYCQSVLAHRAVEVSNIMASMGYKRALYTSKQPRAAILGPIVKPQKPKLLTMPQDDVVYLGKMPEVVLPAEPKAKKTPKVKAAKAPAVPVPELAADGVWVLHKVFGRGMIVSEVEGNIQVSFAEVGLKTISGKFAHLLTKE